MSVDYSILKFRAAARAKEEDTAVTIVCKNDGALHVWHTIESEVQLQWFKRTLDKVFELVKEDI